MKNQITALIATVIILITSCESSDKTSNQTSPPQGEIALEFQPQINSVPITAPQSQENILEEKLFEEGWERKTFSNGIMPDCFNYKPFYGELDNELGVSVGGGTDVAIKLMSQTSGNCVRYVYINSGNTYRIKNIPQGRYYLKIAYGRNWISKLDGRKCLGRFLNNALYERGEDILDFNKKTTSEGYSIPSYSLKLDVISGSTDNAFNSSGISEGEFNN